MCQGNHKTCRNPYPCVRENVKQCLKEIPNMQYARGNPYQCVRVITFQGGQDIIKHASMSRKTFTHVSDKSLSNVSRKSLKMQYIRGNPYQCVWENTYTNVSRKSPHMQYVRGKSLVHRALTYMFLLFRNSNTRHF